MKHLNNIFIALFVTLFVVGLVTSSSVWAARPADDTSTLVFDSSFAVEFSYSCLSGGCHESDQKLVDDYSASVMTHAMVKCNACHGTHTAAEVGQEKPNLTGYTPGIGAIGYVVGRDRCNTCHNQQHTSGRKGADDCVSCHAPHIFAQ